MGKLVKALLWLSPVIVPLTYISWNVIKTFLGFFARKLQKCFFAPCNKELPASSKWTWYRDLDQLFSNFSEPKPVNPHNAFWQTDWLPYKLVFHELFTKPSWTIKIWRPQFGNHCSRLLVLAFIGRQKGTLWWALQMAFSVQLQLIPSLKLPLQLSAVPLCLLQTEAWLQVLSMIKCSFLSSCLLCSGQKHWERLFFPTKERAWEILQKRSGGERFSSKSSKPWKTHCVCWVGPKTTLCFSNSEVLFSALGFLRMWTHPPCPVYKLVNM